MQHVDMFTDGAARGNPGPGGFGCVLRYVDTSGKVHEREISQGYRNTTNNRMELMGVIAGFEALNVPCDVTVTSDSNYVIKAFNDHWVDGWLKRGWVTSGRKPVKNVDLWKRLLDAKKGHTVRWTWVEGHAGHPENERCDVLATTAADSENLIVDTGFAG